MTGIDVDWATVWANMVLLGVSYVLALPIAFNREKASRSAGLRTYPMVAIGACGLMLIGIKVLGSTGAEGRVMQAIITGMGFIGGGAILKGEGEVRGLATASSLWITGAIGIAVAWQRFEIALLLSVLTFLTLAIVPDAKKLVNGGDKDGSAD